MPFAIPPIMRIERQKRCCQAGLETRRQYSYGLRYIDNVNIVTNACYLPPSGVNGCVQRTPVKQPLALPATCPRTADAVK
jgi:hypothetical protein